MFYGLFSQVKWVKKNTQIKLSSQNFYVVEHNFLHGCKTVRVNKRFSSHFSTKCRKNRNGMYVLLYFEILMHSPFWVLKYNFVFDTDTEWTMY